MKKSLITFKVGTRSSKLAISQCETSLDKIKTLIDGISFELITFDTTGDNDQNLDLRQSPENFFTQQIDEALNAGSIDCAIHSAKDLPNNYDENIDFFWLPWNELPNDVIVLPKNKTIEELPKFPVVGISSERREEFCKKNFPNAVLKNIRGNIEERIQQLDNGNYDFIILAAAGINRLNLSDRISHVIPLSQLKPPDGQGYIAMTFRKNDKRFYKIRSLFTPGVIFAGAGVGDKSLCTKATIDALRDCEICLYDSLMDHDLLDELSSNAEAIDVGKRCGAHSKQQQVITDLLCNRSRRGKKVVRLKGGDPGIFGRLTEETDALENLHISYRVIPGISALQAATTGTGMLLTRRDVSRGFVALTPRAAAGKLASCNAKEKAALPIVYYMSIKAMDHITNELLNDGFKNNTPVAVIYNAGGDDQEILHTQLFDLPKLGKNYCSSNPGLIIVGDITSYKYKSGLGALKGEKILLTCSDALQKKACAYVYRFGGNPISFPLIKLSLKENFFEDLSSYSWIVISSPSSAKAFIKFINENEIDRRKIPAIMTCGKETSNELRKYNIHVDAEPKNNFSAKELINLARSLLSKEDKVLRLRSDKAGDELANKLAETGAHVIDSIIYENSPVLHNSLPDFDVIFFSSSSTVESFIEQWGEESLRDKKLLTIGKPTAEALLKYKLLPTLVSKESTVYGAISSLASFTVSQDLKLLT